MSVEITVIDDSVEEETETFSGGLSVTASQSIVPWQCGSEYN